MVNGLFFQENIRRTILFSIGYLIKEMAKYFWSNILEKWRRRLITILTQSAE